MSTQTRAKEETVPVPKSELARLKKQAKAYRTLAASVFALNLNDPVGMVVSDFRDTDRYSKEFLKDLEVGLRRSSYAKKV